MRELASRRPEGRRIHPRNLAFVFCCLNPEVYSCSYEDDRADDTMITLKNNKMFTLSFHSAPYSARSPCAPPRINFTEGVDSEWRTDETRDKLMKAERAQRGRERDMCDNRRSKEGREGNSEVT